MKVAVISRAVYPLHGVGGLERHVRTAVKYLVREGAEVTLYVPPWDSAATADAIEGVGIETAPYRYLPLPRRAGFVIADRVTNYLLWSLRIAARIASCPVDIVQAEGAAGFGYALTRMPDRTPFVLQAHGMEEFKAKGLKAKAYLPLRAATRFAAHRAAAVIAPDRVMLDEVMRYLRPRPERLTALPMAIDLEEIDRPVSEETCTETFARCGIEPRMTVILSVGRLESNKGFGVLVHALAKNRAFLPEPTVWVVVGGGSEETALRRRVSELRLQDITRFVGRVSDEALSVLYERASLFVHPTLFEGSSLVTLEAMAHSKAVVATRIGGIPDKVEDGRTGFLVPANDPDSLGREVLRILSSESFLAEAGRRARKRVESEFSWNRRARELMGLYRRVVEEHRCVQKRVSPPFEGIASAVSPTPRLPPVSEKSPKPAARGRS